MTENLLTKRERRALALSGELASEISYIIHDGTPVLPPATTADKDAAAGDINEMVGAIHVLQRMIAGQAAARAYPTEYRLLGRSL